MSSIAIPPIVIPPIVIPANACLVYAPPLELFDYPLFFPKPNFRAKPPPPSYDAKADEEFEVS